MASTTSHPVMTSAATAPAVIRSFLFGGIAAHSASRFGLEPYPSSYFVVRLLRLLVQFLPDLIAIAALVKHYVSYPKDDCTKDQKAKNTHLAPP
jgi:hypothetical protein